MYSNLRFGQLEGLMADFTADMGKLNSRIVRIESRLSSLEDKFDQLLDMFMQFMTISDERYEEFQNRFNKIEELYIDTLDKKSFEHFVDAILDRMDEIKTVQTKTDILDKKVDKLEVDNIEIKSKLDLILAKLSP